MHLTQLNDYALRVLLYVGAKESPASLDEMASAYRISRNHLIKAVNILTKLGFLHTRRGVGGGISLARPAAEINIGEVIRLTEPGGFRIVECFDAASNTCVLSPACKLKGALKQATRAFFQELEAYTLADLLPRKGVILNLLKNSPASADS